MVIYSGEVGIEGVTEDKKSLSNTRTQYISVIKKMVQGISKQDHAMFFRPVGIRLPGLDSVLKICQSSNIKGRTQT